MTLGCFPTLAFCFLARRQRRAIIDSTMASNSSTFECDICNEDYDSVNHKPLVLACGHSFCRVCLSRLEMTGNKICPNCRKPIAQTVNQLPVNYALISSKGNASTTISTASKSEKCQNHGCQAEYLCVDCGDLSCWKCCRDLHLNHRVESVDDIIDNGSVSYARAELHKKIQAKLDGLLRSLEVSEDIFQLFETLRKCKAAFEDVHDFQQVLENSVTRDLKTWNALTSNSSEVTKETLKDIMRRINEVEPPQNPNLSVVTAKLLELSNKAAEIEKLAQESCSKLASEVSRCNDETVMLLPDNEAWTVSSEAEVQSALNSVHAGRRPTTVTVISQPSEPIRRLHVRLDILGSACIGDLEVKLLDAFWRPSTGADGRLQNFIESYGVKLCEFFGSPADAIAVNRGRSDARLLLGVRLASMADVELCSELTTLPYSVCCIQGLPATAGDRIRQLGWRPFLWHFPDLQDGTLDWMITILESFKAPSVVMPVWTTCAPILGIRLGSCYMPRCLLTEEGYRRLLARYPEFAPTLCCESASLSAEAQARLTDLAEQKSILLEWKIPM